MRPVLFEVEFFDRNNIFLGVSLHSQDDEYLPELPESTVTYTMTGDGQRTTHDVNHKLIDYEILSKLIEGDDDE